MNEQRLLYLINRLQAGKASTLEEKELRDWYNAFDEVEIDNRDINKPEYLQIHYNDLLGRAASLKRKQKTFRIAWRATAAAVLLAVAVTFSWKYSQSIKKLPVIAKTDIAPGHSGAILTLANGSTILLDSAGNGAIAAQDNTQIINSKGQLVYDAGDIVSAKVTYNKLTTPLGRQYRLTLPDGTRVWLNAASSIRYPVAFTGRQRLVEITGEAYFEVVHNAAMPFKVKAGENLIEDIGTAFDVNAYADEPSIKTTLLEGRVQVSVNNEPPVLLTPGYQSIVNGSTIKIKSVDAVAVAAWTKGVFSFTNADIEEVMRQFARWYNVQVVCEPGLRRRTFSGKIYRNLSASQALNALNFMNLNFKIENTPQGKRIRVMP